MGELQQTVVNILKESNGGRLTSEQVAQLKQASLDKVKAIMDEPSLTLLDSVGVDFEELVRAYVEKTVDDIRMTEMKFNSRKIIWKCYFVRFKN